MIKEKDSQRKTFKRFLRKSKMIILVFILIENIIYIMIIDYYNFMIRIESLDWIPYIFRVPLYCNEIIDDFDNFDNFEDYEQYPLDNYYSDQEYWFEGDD